jgi:hypothetical protein
VAEPVGDNCVRTHDELVRVARLFSTVVLDTRASISRMPLYVSELICIRFFRDAVSSDKVFSFERER